MVMVDTEELRREGGGAHRSDSSDIQSNEIKIPRGKLDEVFRGYAREAVLSWLGLRDFLPSEAPCSEADSSPDQDADAISRYVHGARQIIEAAISIELSQKSTSKRKERDSETRSDSQGDEQTFEPYPTQGLGSIFQAFDAYFGKEWYFGGRGLLVDPEVAYPDLLDIYMRGLHEGVLDEKVTFSEARDCIKEATLAALEITLARYAVNFNNLVVFDGSNLDKFEAGQSRYIASHDLDRLEKEGLKVLVDSSGKPVILPAPLPNSDPAAVLRRVFNLVIMFTHGEGILHHLESIRTGEKFVTDHARSILIVGLLTGKLLTFGALLSIGMTVSVVRKQMEMHRYMELLEYGKNIKFNLPPADSVNGS